MDKSHAKTIPISEILDKLNVKPRRINKTKALYLSPIRNEKTPSFWVYFDNNRWYDFGISTGGDVIDFARHYLKYTNESHNMVDAMRWLENMSSGNRFNILALIEPTGIYQDEEQTLFLRSKNPVQHIGIIQYLEKRGIPLAVARKYLNEIRVFNKATGRSFFALGFKNENGGYELRNPFFKGCIKPKTVSFIRGSNPDLKRIHIFEGFMDYVSVITQLNGKSLADDALILNSLACINKALPYIEGYGYRTAYTWLDNDQAGERANEILASFFKTQDDLRHVQMNAVYAPHKDVNAWHMHKLGLKPLPS